MTPDEIMELLEPFRSRLAEHFKVVDIQPLQHLELLSGEISEEVVIRLIK